MASPRVEDLIRGTIIETLRGDKFKVEVETPKGSIVVLATIGGKLRVNKIRLLIGDSVGIDVSEYDPTRGRIMWRY